MSAFDPLRTLACALPWRTTRSMPLTGLEIGSLIAILCGVGFVTYLLNRSGQKWGWYFLAGLIFFIVTSIVVWSAFNFATGGLKPVP